ncbi:MYND-type domain-containing protein [Mycena indigotica]|uniref:phytol kinase n=1 Tax=Mycena indigotica TaxID=2126181 RepID=A0A8H6T3D9_9AGAR|nr:MYND-type domain-containing protein [Mycena indigotica]KAF7310159.1 MYND-type domain-containing protein [Mycena indigotica]
MHDLLQPSALEKLPADIKAAANVVALPNARPTDFDPIAAFLRSEAEETTKIHILPALFALLDPARITDKPNPDHIFLAWAALREFVHLGVSAVPAAKDLWTANIGWLRFLYADPVSLAAFMDNRKEPIGPALDKVVMSLLFSLIPPFPYDGADHEAFELLSVPGSIKLIFRAWARIFQKPNGPEAESKERARAGYALFAVLTSRAVTSREGFQQAVEGAGGTLEKLGQALYYHLDSARHQLQDSVADADTFLTTLSAARIRGALHFIRSTDPVVRDLPLQPNPLLNAMLELGLVPLLCSIMYTYSTVPNPEDQIIKAIAGPALNLLSFIVSFPPGHHHIPEMLRHRFFDALVNLAPADFHTSTAEDRYMLTSFFTSILPAALIRTSVLEVLADVLPGLASAVANDAFKQTPFFKTCWKAFARVATERLALFERFRAGDFPVQKMCDNLECARVGPEADFKRCSGCRVLVYCSEACQKADWRDSGHKRGCAALRQYHEHDAALDLTPTDRDFLRVLMDTDYRTSSLRAIASQPGGTTLYRYGERPGRIEQPSAPPCGVIELFGSEAAAREVIRRLALGQGKISLDVAEFWSGLNPLFMLALRHTQLPGDGFH